MSLFSTSPAFSAGLLDVSIGLVLMVKWTIVLALAWLGHGMLAGRNPRWRVALWRLTIAGLALVTVLSSAPPIVPYRIVTEQRAPVESRPIDRHPAIVQRESTARAGIVRTSRETAPGS